VPGQFSLPSEQEVNQASDHGLSEIGTCMQNKMFWTSSQEKEWGLFKETITYIITTFTETLDGSSGAAFGNISDDNEQQALLCVGVAPKQ